MGDLAELCPGRKGRIRARKGRILDRDVVPPPARRRRLPQGSRAGQGEPTATWFPGHGQRRWCGHARIVARRPPGRTDPAAAPRVARLRPWNGREQATTPGTIRPRWARSFHRDFPALVTAAPRT